MAIKFNELAVTKFVKDAQKTGANVLASIESVPGLNITVSKHGAASYVVRYHVAVGTKRREKKHVLGRHGVITLADAKTEALKMMRERELGSDPIEVARIEKQRRAAATTLKAMWERRIAHDDKLSASSIEKYTTHLKADVWPTLGNTPAGAITADDIVDVLTQVEKRSKHVAHNVRAALSGLYRYGVQRRWVQKNPVTGLGFSIVSKPRKRRMNDEELARLWTAIDNEKHQGSDGTKLALKLAVLLGQRPSELLAARISELDLDGPTPKYSPPAERMKRKSEADEDQHIVPLSLQAVDLFRSAVLVSKELGDGDFVFPGHAVGRHEGRAKNTHLGRHGLSAALGRVCKIAGIKNFRNHDWRKVMITWLSERGTAPYVLDKILHHAPRGITASHYDHSILEGPMREALQRWSDHVWALTEQSTAETNVVKLKSA